MPKFKQSTLKELFPDSAKRLEEKRSEPKASEIDRVSLSRSSLLVSV